MKAEEMEEIRKRIEQIHNEIYGMEIPTKLFGFLKYDVQKLLDDAEQTELLKEKLAGAESNAWWHRQQKDELQKEIDRLKEQEKNDSFVKKIDRLEIEQLRRDKKMLLEMNDRLNEENSRLNRENERFSHPQVYFDGDPIGKKKNKKSGLYSKYRVTHADGSPVHSFKFVLSPETDPAALEALRTYSIETKNKKLHKDLLQIIFKIENGTVEGEE